MEKMLKFNSNQKYEVRKLYGYDDANKLKQDLDHFEDWIKKQNHFVVREFDREYLESYLISSKGSLERAKKRFDKLCTLRLLMPEFLQNFDIENEFNDLLSTLHITGLPQPTPENYRVTVCTFVKNGDVDKLDLLKFYRYMIVLIDYMLKHDYNAGSEFVFDTQHFTVGMLTKLNPLLLQKASTLIMDAYGARVKCLHYITGSKVFETVVTIFKQALNSKMNKRIMIHCDYESLYQVIPKKILPSDFGGDERSMAELSASTIKLASAPSHIAFMKQLEEAVTNEDLRLSTKFNEEYSGMPGSFKKLCVD